MKTYTVHNSLSIALVSVFLVACGASNTAQLQSKPEEQLCMKKDQPDKILALLKAHRNEPSDSKIYVVFIGEACLKCPLLKRKISNVRLDAKLIYLNAEFTWAFILSQHIGVRGIPSLVVFIQGVPKFVREGNASILEYLHGNAVKGFE